MTLLDRISLPDEHTVQHGVSWEEYERTLKEIGDGPTRVTYCDGSMEIMSPLAEHDDAAEAIGLLIRELTFEFGLPIHGFGSTTYRRKDIRKGLEPDRCYYIRNEAKVRGMKRFNPKVHPAPDLAVEVDITRRSTAREPIYAALGMAEIWRYKKGRITIRRLSGGTYLDSATSIYFPPFPMERFEEFVRRMSVEEQNSVVRDFREWARTLRR